MKKTIGIIGGMGPEATCDLLGKIIAGTPAEKDQDHIPVLVDNNTRIPDRTAHLMGKGPSPLPELVRTALRLETMGADILVMPCNTAHHYRQAMLPYLDARFPSMLEETAEHILRAFPETRTVGLMATTGTYASGLYRKELEKRGLSLAEPSEQGKALLLKWIYALKGGHRQVPESELLQVLKAFGDAGASTVILGCTELPLLFSGLSHKALEGFRFVDATRVLARAAVRLALEEDPS